MRTAKRVKRVWGIGDFAKRAGVSHGRAKRLLLKLDAKHGGLLLRESNGVNRDYTFIVATLARLEPDIIERPSTEDLEMRLRELEERMEEVGKLDRRMARAVVQLTQEIERLGGLARRPARSAA